MLCVAKNTSPSQVRMRRKPFRAWDFKYEFLHYFVKMFVIPHTGIPVNKSEAQFLILFSRTD